MTQPSKLITGLLLLLLIPSGFIGSAMAQSTTRAECMEEIGDAAYCDALFPENGAEDSLYKRIKRIEQQHVDAVAEYLIEKFVVKALGGNVDAALEQDLATVCEGGGTDYDSCLKLVTDIETSVRREGAVRRLGRDLQLTVAGYELPTDERIGKPFAISPRYSAILHLWQSGTDPLLTTITEQPMTAEAYPEDLEPAFDALEESLTELKGKKDSIDRLAAAVHRYRYGYKEVKEEEEDTSMGEWILLEKRWPDVEDALDAIWQGLPTSTEEEEEESEKNTSVHTLYPTRMFEDLGIVVWAHEDDVGLAWEFPIEPVLPTVIDPAYIDCIEDEDNDAAFCDEQFPNPLFLGGTYPPEPVDPAPGTGLCAQPLGRNGYLCRPVETEECPTFQSNSSAGSTSATDAEERDPRALYAVTCRAPAFTSDALNVTFSGPDICGIGGWSRTEPYGSSSSSSSSVSDGPDRDPIEPDRCTHCAVDFFCQSTCNGSPDAAFTLEKNDQGTIPICLPESPSGSPAFLPYLAIHEMAHAQQACNAPDTFITQDLRTCCASEYQAYFAQCNALAEDGLLQGIVIDGNEQFLSPQSCATILSNLSCTPTQGGQDTTACSDPPFDPVLLAEALVEAADREKDRLGLPTTCTEAVEQLDSRAVRMRETLPSVCSPACQTEYESTIGNHLCYIGECIEQTIEEQRLLPGRMALNVQDASFPWDSCLREDPAIGQTLVLPPITPRSFPPYRPALFVHQMDALVCQLYGQPPGTMPIKCGMDLQRNIQLAHPQFSGVAESILLQYREQEESAEGLAGLGKAMGARLGTKLYEDYLQTTSRTLADLLSAAARALEQFGELEFPSQMCSRTADSCPN